MNQKEFQQILREAIKDGGKLINRSNSRFYVLDYERGGFRVRFAWWFTDMERFGLLITSHDDKPMIVASTATMKKPEELMAVFIRDNRISKENQCLSHLNSSNSTGLQARIRWESGKHGSLPVINV